MTSEIEYFDALCNVCTALDSASRYEDLLPLVVTNAVQAMDGKGAALFLAKEDSDYFECVAETGLSENYRHANPMKAREMMDQVMTDGGHLAVKDATTDPRIPNKEAKKSEGIESLLAVPVVVKNKTIGMLTLYSAKKRDFNDNDIKLLKALAHQGGSAIEHSLLFERVLTYSRLFRDISENINASLDVKDIFQALTSDVCSRLKLKAALIRLKDENTGELKLVASHGLSDTFLNKGPVYFSKGFEKIINGESILIDDVTNGELVQYPDAMVKEGVTSLYTVPVKANDTVIGIMNFLSGGETRFSKSFQEMAQSLGIQGGIAIQNASVHLKLEETKKSLEEDIWGFRSWF